MTGGRTMERDRRSSETRASTDPSRALAPVRESGAGEAAEPVVMMGGLGRHLGLAWLENVFFFAVMICSFVFAVLLLREATWSWSLLLLLVGFWAVMAYLALPRLHRVLTTIYVPDYFIGCSRTTDGRLGDPLNLAFIGDEQQIHETMTRAGWVKADPVTLGSSVRIVVSSLLRRSYAEAPVSPLVLFRRTQEFAYQQEVDGNPSQRHHVRFWPTPDGWLLPGGRRVDWLASGTFDSGVGLSFFTLQVTHRIARDIDTERDHVLRTVTDADAVVSVEMLHDFTSGYHSRNGGGDAVMTDGDLPVVDLTAVAVAPGATAYGVSEDGQVLGTVGRRPPSIVAACVLAVASALVSMAALVWGGDGVLGPNGRDVLGDVPAELPTNVALWIGVLTYVPILWLAYRTFFGGVWARLIMIALVTLSQASQMWQYLQGTRPTFGALLSLSVDLLVVYALTSLSARDWVEHGLVEGEGAAA